MNTQRQPPAHHTIAPPRTRLARLVGRTVTVEARYSNVALQRTDGTWLYHCTNVHVFPSVTVDHVWLSDLPMKARRNLYEGTRFSFSGEVYAYSREDGSSDYGVKFAGNLRVNE
jgi:hypothetical protein